MSSLQFSLLAIKRYTQSDGYADIPWASISCGWLHSLTLVIPDVGIYTSEIFNAILPLFRVLALHDHGYSPELTQYPADALGYVAITGKSSFTPHLKKTMLVLQEISTHTGPDCRVAQWYALRLIGDLFESIGKERFRGYFDIALELVFLVMNDPSSSLRVVSFHVLMFLGTSYKTRLSPHLARLMCLHHRTLFLSEPRNRTSSEAHFYHHISISSEPHGLEVYNTVILKKASAILSFTALIQLTGNAGAHMIAGSIRLLLFLLGHDDISIRDEACSGVVWVFLWDHDNCGMVCLFAPK